MRDLVEACAREDGEKTVLDYIATDRKYVNGLEAHMMAGGGVTVKNIEDMISIVRWLADVAETNIRAIGDPS